MQPTQHEFIFEHTQYFIKHMNDRYIYICGITGILQLNSALFFLGTLKATQELQEKKYNHGNAISRQVKVLTGTGLKHQVLFFRRRCVSVYMSHPVRIERSNICFFFCSNRVAKAKKKSLIKTIKYTI